MTTVEIDQEIFRSMRHALVRSASLMRIPFHIRDEIMDEALVLLVADVERFDGSGSFVGYLGKRARWRLIDALRSLYPGSRGVNAGKSLALWQTAEMVNGPACGAEWYHDPHDENAERDRLILQLSQHPRDHRVMEKFAEGSHTWEISNAIGVTVSRVNQLRAIYRRRAIAKGFRP